VGTEQTSEKAARNLHDGKTKWQHWNHTKYFLFSYCVIFINELNIIRKEYVITKVTRCSAIAEKLRCKVR